MEPLWRWRELCQALSLPSSNGPEVTGIGIDSRRIRPGELFVALKGDPGPRFNASSRSERDGHDFVVHALERGAAGALVHEDLALDAPVLRVEDTLDGLWALARHRRKALGGEVVAVTGSSGKTTAKNLLGAALGAFATPGSLNNHLGVPLSLASTPAGAPAAVFEVGTNHPGEIEMLSRLVRPTTALVLNVHPAHIEFFADLDALRKEKLSIYKGLERNGCLIVEDSIARDELPATLKVLTFGEGEGAHCRLLRCAGRQADYRLAGRELCAQVPGGGRHRALSLGAVLCVLHALGRSLQAACSLPDGLLPSGRGNERRCAGLTLIDDSYNANPASMRAALLSLGGRSGWGGEGGQGGEGGRKIAVLGEMLELGADSAAHHEDLATACAGIDLVAAVGAGMEPLWRKLPAKQRWLWRRRADDELMRRLLAELRSGDLVLLKGSNRVFWSVGFANRLGDALAHRQ